MPRRTASYKNAVAWIVANDDTEWLNDQEPIISVSAALVADLFGRDEPEIIADLRREQKRQQTS